MKKNTKTLLPVLIIALIFWIGIIFLLSSQNGEQTFNLSNGVSSNIIDVFFKGMTQAESVKIHEYLRKVAHISLFGVLGMLLSLIFNIIFSEKGKWGYIISFFISVFCFSGIAFFDEWRKQFIDGRHFDMIDVKLNLVSGFLGVIFVFIAIKVIAIVKKRY
ncbi:MAG: VanZ family protein [Clostridia bacterium]